MFSMWETLYMMLNKNKLFLDIVYASSFILMDFFVIFQGEKVLPHSLESILWRQTQK